MESILQQREPQKAETDRPNLTGIPTQMKLNFEQRSGMSFDDVRVHYNSDKPAQFHALAYTQGTQIYVGPGQERSLPHELGHVIQQKAGRVRPTRWVRGQPVNDQPELEREADRAPVQCMPAPALRGVIQMLPILPRQRGQDCGYHALARAMYTFCNPDELSKLFVKDNFLEMQLTSYAIKTGYSVIGEAFDPHALALVGNKFCKDNHIPIKCTVLSFNSEEDLRMIQEKKGSIFLVPYYPLNMENDTSGLDKPFLYSRLKQLGQIIQINNLDTNPLNLGKQLRDRLMQILGVGEDTLDLLLNYEGPDNSNVKNAHWCAIEADIIPGFYKLYEGNYRGSTGTSDQVQPILPPLKVQLSTLLQSNQNITTSFDWHVFWEQNSAKINQWVKKVNMKMDEGSEAFKEEQDLIRQVNIVKGKGEVSASSSSLPDHEQEVRLKGQVVEVTRN